MSHVDRSFDRLLRPYLERMFRLAFRLTGSRPEAEDLFQDVLVKVYGRIDELVDVDAPGPWLNRVLYNHFIDNQRRFKRQRLVVVDGTGERVAEAGDDRDDPARTSERLDNIMQLDRALSMLSEEHRLVLLLHDAEGYKLTEIQELTGTPVGTIKSRLHRARARLREILAADGTFSEDLSCTG